MQFLLSMRLDHKACFKKTHNICPCACAVTHLTTQYLSGCPEQGLHPFLLGFSSVKPSSNTATSFPCFAGGVVIFPAISCQCLMGFLVISQSSEACQSSEVRCCNSPFLFSYLSLAKSQISQSMISQSQISQSMSLVPHGAKQENLRDMYLRNVGCSVSESNHYTLIPLTVLWDFFPYSRIGV